MTSIPWSRINTGLLLLVLLAIIVLFASRAYGGPLDPPGPVASTQSNVIYQPASCAGFPIVLSNPGSYRLGSNITGCAGKDGIQIVGGNITLDLAGFGVLGVGGSLKGIRSIGGIGPLSVANGLVATWGGDGLDLGSSGVDRVENIIAAYNSGAGIVVGGHSTVTGNTAAGNVFEGFFVTGDQSMIIGNTLTANANGMRVAGSSNWIDSNLSSGNHSRGFDVDPVPFGEANVITRNVASANGVTDYSIGANNDIASESSAANATNPMANVAD